MAVISCIAMKKIVILENIRSAFNVGSIFRTADGAGVAHVFLVGHTPAPIDRFGRVQPEIAKTSLGATEFIPWDHVDSISDALEKVKSSGYTVVAVEQTENASDIKGFQVPEMCAYVFGNEIDGVSKECLARVDVVVEIPMHGEKESLNVGVTAGIVLFQ